jgi:hypothetical protein
MDQNENQVTHDIEILQSIKATAEQLSQQQAKVTQGDLVACVSKRNPAKVSPHALMNLCKSYIGFLDNGVVDLVTDLVGFSLPHCGPSRTHSEYISSRLLCLRRLCPSVPRLGCTW